MKIPDKVKIGALWYDVHMVPMVKEIGGVDYSGQEIMVEINSKRPMMEVSFLHEVIHAINNEIDETEVEFLAQGLYQFLVENDMLK